MGGFLLIRCHPGNHEDGLGDHVGVSGWDRQCDCSKDPRCRRYCSVGWGSIVYIRAMVGFVQGDVAAWALHRHRLLGSLLLPAARLPDHLPRRRQKESFSVPLWPSSSLDDCIRHSLHVSTPL